MPEYRPMPTAIPIEEIERRALAGDVQAQRLLLQWLRDVAATGNIAAKRALGQVLLTRPPYDIAGGVAATLEAADAGDAGAAQLASVLAGSGIGVAQSWRTALHYTRIAAERGNQVAQATLVALSNDSTLAMSVESGTTTPPETWTRLAASVDIESWLRTPSPAMLCTGPDIFAIAAFASPALCDWLIARARPRLARSQVIDSNDVALREDEIRTNRAMNFNLLQSDLLLVILRARMAAVLGRRIPEMEATAVLHYSAGQRYGAHFDFLDPALPGCREEVSARGQRVATFLVYLNEDFEGGETEFPTAGIRFKGRKGDAIFFPNVDENGTPDRRTLHAGLSPTRGEKWLLSQWVRDREGVMFGPVLPAH
jgi:hypothetical protein